jgi:predicted RNase H-like HicB family nuclease
VDGSSGFTAVAPVCEIKALPGCHTQAETLDEIRGNLREAAEGWLAVAHEDGLARDAAGAAP